MTKKGENIIFGHNNTFNDPSISIAYKDNLFSENVGPSNHLQNSFLYKSDIESFNQLKNLLKKRGIPLLHPKNILFRTTWNPSITKNLFKTEIPENNFSLFSQNIFFKKLPLTLFQIKKKLIPNSNKNFKHYKTDHQLSHASNAVYTSTFDRCAIMVIDEFGEKFSTTFYKFKNNSFHVIQKNEASLGQLYSTVTELCGFTPNENGHSKMIELSSSGEFNQNVYDFFKKRIKRKGLRIAISFKSEDQKELKKMVLSSQRVSKACLAYSFQEFFSDTIIDLATSLANITKETNLAYGGTCALNHLTNGKIITHTPFKNLHIPSAPGDNGNSLGALLYQKYKVFKEPRSLCWPVFGSSPYLGATLNSESIENTLKQGPFYYEEAFEKHILLKKISGLLAKGHIVGWVQGKSEFSSRGLGNRSILADPRQLSIKEKFEKNHLAFAFGVSILHEFGPTFFQNYQNTPYMEKSLLLKEESLSLVTSPSQKNRLVQVQSVHKELNPIFHSLLKEFQGLTKIPLILNANLEVSKESPLKTIEDFLSLLLTNKLNILVLGNFIVKRR